MPGQIASTVMMGEPEAASQKPTPLTARAAARLRVLIRRHRGALGLALVLAVGLAARVVLSSREGHILDISWFLRWMRGLVEHGLGGFWESGPRCNYPPLHLLILRALGEVLSRFDPGLQHDQWLRAWLRAPACLADVLVTLMLYVEVRRLANARAAVLAGALYFLNPVALYNSAYWGQVDSIHSALVLLAIVGLNRRCHGLAGVAITLALLQKLQSVVFLPLVLFDVYRWRRWRGLGRCAGGAAVAAVVVLAPYAATESLRPALRGGYQKPLGQYNTLSVNAFNLWYLADDPAAPDDAVPMPLVRLAADGAEEVARDESWLMLLTARTIAMGLFTLAVALILSAYSRRHTAAARSLAAGVLALAFFCLLTEMHERYSYPAIALLPIWAVTGAWKERAYLLVSVLMLLNLTVAQPVGRIGGDIGGMNLLLGGLLFVVLLWPAAGASIRANDGEGPPARRNEQLADAPPPSVVVSWFVRLTVAAALCALVVSALLGWQARRAAVTAAMSVRPSGVIYLGDLKPRVNRQGYGELRVDRAVQGGPLRLGNRYFLRGLGAHAPSMIEYELPEGFTRLRAVAGIDRQGKGRAALQVHLDGRRVLELGPMTAEDEPIEIDLPLDGAKRLRLSAKTLGSKKGDHIDWALARLEE